MPRIPERDYTVSALEERKLYAVTYVYETDEGWFADTWNVTSENNLGAALSVVNQFCSANVDNGNWVSYDITNINLVRGAY